MGTKTHVAGAEGAFLTEAELNSGTKPSWVTTFKATGRISLDPGTGEVFSVTTAGVLTAASISAPVLTGLGALTITGAFAINPGSGNQFQVSTAGVVTQSGNLTLTGTSPSVANTVGDITVGSAGKVRLVPAAGFAARLPVATTDPTQGLQVGDIYVESGTARPRFYTGAAWRYADFVGDLVGQVLTDSVGDIQIQPAASRNLRIRLPDSAGASDLLVSNLAGTALFKVRSDGRVDLGLGTKGVRIPAATADPSTTGLVSADAGLTIYRSDLSAYRTWTGSAFQTPAGGVNAKLGAALVLAGATTFSWAGSGVNVTDDGTGGVNINISQGVGITDASTSFKGVVLLTTAPANATQPIAVGTNDSRMHARNADLGTSSNIFSIGDGSAVSDKVLEAATGQTNPPRQRWNQVTGKWEFSHDGVAYVELGFTPDAAVTVKGIAKLSSAPASGPGPIAVSVTDTAWIKADGSRAFTAAIVGVDPTLDTQLATLATVKAQVASVGGFYAAPVQALIDLRAIVAANRQDKQVRLIEDAGAFYRYDAQATAGDERPDDNPTTGYWIRASGTLKAFDEGGSLGPVTEIDFAGAMVSAAVSANRLTVTVSAAAPVDASDTIKGVTKLSVAAATATNPKAVGDNDPRMLATTDAQMGLFASAQKLKLDTIESGAQVNNLTGAQATDLIDGGDSSAHYHVADRARANHSGTQLKATISDFGHGADHETTGADAIPSLPTAAQKLALAGTSGIPSGTNKYVTNADTRLSDARPAASHKASHEDGGADEIVLTGLSGRAADAQNISIFDESVDKGLTSRLKVLGDLASIDIVSGEARLTVTSASIPKAGAGVLGVVVLTNDPANPALPAAVADTDGRVPTQSENDALQTITGQAAPSTFNRFVTDTDLRMLTQANRDAAQIISGQPAPSNTNRFVTHQDTRLPAQNENDAMTGTAGTPGSGNPYVTTQDARLHSPNTDTGTNANTFSLGNGGAGNKSVLFNNADVNKPGLRFEDTTNKVQFTNDGTVWKDVGEAVAAAPSNFIDTLVPEYMGAVVFFDGTLNEAGALGLTTGFDPTNFHNFYEWTTDATGTNDVSVVVRFRLPANFVSWNALRLFNQVIQGLGGMAKVEARMWGTNNAEVTLTNGGALQNTTWTESAITVGAGAFTAGGYVTLRLTLYAGQLDKARIGELRLDFN